MKCNFARNVVCGLIMLKNNNKLTRHSWLSAPTFFNHIFGLTNQRTRWNCVFRITRNVAGSLVKAIALVRFLKVEHLNKTNKKNA